jgi:NAD(P)-dependent dehydrogenase (short-subunit alcohol dehydrogenase family)
VQCPLNDQVIVVTGGSGLIGAQFVRAIADAGAVAIIADIDEARGKLVSDNLRDEASGRKVECLAMDITSADSIDGLIATLMDRHGRIDGVVNNAYPRNANYGRKLEDVTYDDFVANLGMHVGGYFLTSQRFLVPFRKSGRGGSIVNMGSIYGVIAPRFDVYQDTTMTMPVEYAAIKSAVIHMTRYFAQYAKGQGIRVNCISPGGVLDSQPTTFLEAYRAYAGDKGMLSASDLEGALLFLLSGASRYVNGQNIVVDDGWSL